MLDKDSLNSEISVGVTFASLMAAISLFFTGVLVAQFDSFGPTIKVPLLFLIISTFSFIFAATIYNNAGTEVTLGKLKTVEKYMIYAKNIVEFLGLYPLILSVPLVIGAVTQDNFLRLSTTFVALVGMALYSQSKFSVLEKQLSSDKKRLYTAIVVALALSLYVAQVLAREGTSLPYSSVAIMLLLCLLLPAVLFSVRSRQYRMVVVRPFRVADAEPLSRLVHKNLDKAKLDNSSRALIESLRKNTSEDAIAEMAEKHSVLVAVSGNKRAGFLVLEDATISSVWTDPGIQRKGVGRMLVEAAETAASELGYEETEAMADASNVKFFQKLGYEFFENDASDRMILRKDI